MAKLKILLPLVDGVVTTEVGLISSSPSCIDPGGCDHDAAGDRSTSCQAPEGDDLSVSLRLERGVLDANIFTEQEQCRKIRKFVVVVNNKQQQHHHDLVFSVLHFFI